MSYQTYKVLHVLGIILTFMALSGIYLYVMGGKSHKENPHRKLLAALHGMGLFIILLGGFGMMARLNFDHGAPWPNWIRAKFALWFLLGGLLMVPIRLPALTKPIYFALPLIGTAVAYIAVFKPF